MEKRTSVLVKFPEGLLERVAAYARSLGVDRMAGILDLVEAGLKVEAGGAPPSGSRPGRKAEKVEQAARAAEKKAGVAVKRARELPDAPPRPGSGAGSMVSVQPGRRMSDGPQRDMWSARMAPAPRGKK